MGVTVGKNREMLDKTVVVLVVAVAVAVSKDSSCIALDTFMTRV